MQLRIILCALVALSAYATPVVAANPKSVKLISKNDNEKNLIDNLEVLRLKRAAEETDVPRLEDFQRLIKVFEKFFHSERLTSARNTNVIKFIMQFLKLVENYMNSNNNDISIENSSE
ncbi:hypothetical protein LSTR_LSTR011202 [Laodelphax striatellus]|uniref:Uncharacterized protein n=1 Tax=Laodelphax striatellus TaxID=195883 RepID=A0A482X427_LAOST|nr:hypothetical protein LSTR_LSTR011202 [Laodelphax striatellus]